jgi:hypothetical protein
VSVEIVESLKESLELYDKVEELKIVADFKNEQTRGKLPAGVLMQVEGVWTRHNRINRNGRAYGDMSDAIAEVQPLIKERQIVGCDGHPEKGFGEAGKQSMLLTGLWSDGKVGRFSADIPETDSGKNVAALIRVGFKYGVSTKGNGGSKRVVMNAQHPWFENNRDYEGREFEEVQPDYRFNKFQPLDFVIGPSVPEAMTTGFYEQAGLETRWEKEKDMATEKELNEKIAAAEAAAKVKDAELVDLKAKLEAAEKGAEARAKTLTEEIDKKIAEAAEKAKAEAVSPEDRKILETLRTKPNVMVIAEKIAEAVTPKAPPAAVDEKDKRTLEQGVEIAALRECVERQGVRIKMMETEKKADEERAAIEKAIDSGTAGYPALRAFLVKDLRDRCKTEAEVAAVLPGLVEHYKGFMAAFGIEKMLEQGATGTLGHSTIAGAPPDQVGQVFRGTVTPGQSEKTEAAIIADVASRLG